MKISAICHKCGDIEDAESGAFSCAIVPCHALELSRYCSRLLRWRFGCLRSAVMLPLAMLETPSCWRYSSRPATLQSALKAGFAIFADK